MDFEQAMNELRAIRAAPDWAAGLPSLLPEDRELPDELPEPSHEPGDGHCGAGGPPKPDHVHYRRCRCGLWYFWTGYGWTTSRPSARWLRRHGLGMNTADFLIPVGHEERDTPSGRFTTTTRWWRYALRSLLRR